MFSRVFEFLENLRPKTACMLPKHARYRTAPHPEIGYFIIAESPVFVKGIYENV
jgi:hypothetical protein